MEFEKRTAEQGLRARASLALRRRIIVAFRTALTKEDFDSITLDAVSLAASTTRQTILRMFQNKDGLLIALVEQMQFEITTNRMRNTGPDSHAIAHAFITDLDLVGDLVVRLLSQENRIPYIAAHFGEARERHLRYLQEQLAPSLAELNSAHAEMMLVQVRAVTDTLFWKILRRDLHLDTPVAINIVTDLIDRVLSSAPQLSVSCSDSDKMPTPTLLIRPGP